VDNWCDVVAEFEGIRASFVCFVLTFSFAVNEASEKFVLATCS
jgi:hypothetical protein